MPGWLNAASCCGSRSPARIARTMRCPVQPLKSLMTLASWTFICVSTFCMRWMQVLTARTWSPRWRQYVPHDANVGGGVKRVAEEAVGVQLQEPLALLDVTLAPRQV